MQKVKSFLENFWYYHKWKLAAFIVVSIAVVMSVAQCAARAEHDYTFVLFTYNEYDDSQLDAMGKYFANYGEDLNGDGEVTIGFNNCSYHKETTSTSLWRSKISRLQSTVISEEDQLIFITDEESFTFLNTLFPETPTFVNIGLPNDNGCSYLLPEQFYTDEVKGLLEPPEKLRLSIRLTDNVENIGGSGELGEHLENAVDFMSAISDAELKFVN